MHHQVVGAFIFTGHFYCPLCSFILEIYIHYLINFWLFTRNLLSPIFFNFAMNVYMQRLSIHLSSLRELTLHESASHSWVIPLLHFRIPSFVSQSHLNFDSLQFLMIKTLNVVINEIYMFVLAQFLKHWFFWRLFVFIDLLVIFCVDWYVTLDDCKFQNKVNYF